MIKRSQQERLWMTGAALVAFAVAAIGYLFFIGPQRSDTDDVHARTAQAQTQNAALQHDITVLQSQNTKLAAYRSALEQARLALPATSGLPAFLRTLQAIGSATSTDVTSLSVGAPTSPGAANGAAAPAPTSSGSSSTASTAPTGTSAPSTSTVYALPITAQLTGTPAHLQSFLTQLQAVQPRAVLISGIVQGSAVASGSTGSGAASGTSLQLTMQAFMAPGPEPVAATPTPASSTAPATTP